MPNLLEASDLNPELLAGIFQQTDTYRDILAQPPGSFERRELATMHAGTVASMLFFSDSTRTEHSFVSAAARLGMAVDNVNVNKLSTNKGESFDDTLTTFSGYSDVIVLRHPEEGKAKHAAEVCEGSRVVIINGGDGSNEHPTQAWLDAYTIRDKVGRLENLKILMGNDLRYSRTGHSLVRVMTQFGGNEFIFVSTQGLSIPDATRHHLLETETKFTEVENAYPYLGTADVVSWARSQRERWPTPALACETVQFDRRKMRELRDGAIVMHPMPMTPEEMDPLIIERPNDYPKFIAHEQARNGVPLRMALLEYALSGVTVEPVRVPAGV